MGQSRSLRLAARIDQVEGAPRVRRLVISLVERRDYWYDGGCGDGHSEKSTIDEIAIDFCEDTGISLVDPAAEITLSSESSDAS